jgi:hypothetical protein
MKAEGSKVDSVFMHSRVSTSLMHFRHRSESIFQVYDKANVQV